MKRAIYGTILLFVGILILVAVISEHHGLHLVTYENGTIKEAAK
jgi:hypothetical protein